MTPNEFRDAALALPGAEERTHQKHPDFRVNGKIFATLGYPDHEWSMVKIHPDRQAALCTEFAGVFVPSAGAWGRAGCTLVHLAKAITPVVERALLEAHAAVASAPARKPRTRAQATPSVKVVAKRKK